MTLEGFARRFGGVTHPAIVKWEQAVDRPTTMSWAVEKDIRLEILRSISQIEPSAFLKAYSSLARKRAARQRRLRLPLGAA